jgi:5'-nucleotidase
MDVPAIAVSVTSHEAKHFSYAARIAARFCRLIWEKGLKKGSLLNINVPDLPENEIKGLVLTKQGKTKWDDFYERRVDPYGVDYYWLKGDLVNTDESLLYDQYAALHNYASVTPIHFDLTDHEAFNEMEKWDIGNLKID